VRQGLQSAFFPGDRAGDGPHRGQGPTGAAATEASLSKLDLLVLDELRYVPATKVGAELLFDVIATAYERSSVMVTTNLPFENWTEVLGSERLTGATLDRLTHRCKIIETKGESYRLQDASKRARAKKT
jgi:DNA replication protein DnaC